ncbi:hypothetical protein ACA910_008409 [Epithemia clementina (nom. ined.)]
MINQPLLSPLCGKHYNMAQQQIHHVTILKNQAAYDNRPFGTSFTSSHAHLCTTSSAPSYYVTDYCNQDSPLDLDAYHTTAQALIRSEYFEAFHQLQNLIVQKKPVNNKVTHGETTNDPNSTCVEQLHATKAPHKASEEKVPNKAFTYAEPYRLANHSSPLLHFDLHAHFRVSTLSTPPKLSVPYKITSDPLLGMLE